MVSHDDLLAEGQRRYPEFLRAVLEGRTFFPLDLRIGKSRRAKTYTERSAELAKFRSAAVGLGVTVDWREVKDPRFGTHERPGRAYFADEQSYLRALGKIEEVSCFRKDIALIRTKCPELEAWLTPNVRIVVEYREAWPELLRVVQWFRDNPRSDLYLRQIPVEGVDTKFFERYRSILDGLLLNVQPEVVDHHKERFEARHGLRWEEPMIRLRFLDERLQLAEGYPVSDFALPALTFRFLPWKGMSVFITENLRNFLALPSLANTVAILGGGDAVVLLANAKWLTESRIWYWGDLDARGFSILDRLRREYPQTKSILMDFATLQAHRRWAVKLPQACVEAGALEPNERSAFEYVCKEGLRLEQERIPFAAVINALKTVTNV